MIILRQICHVLLIRVFKKIQLTFRTALFRIDLIYCTAWSNLQAADGTAGMIQALCLLSKEFCIAIGRYNAVRQNFRGISCFFYIALNLIRIDGRQSTDFLLPQLQD